MYKLACVGACVYVCVRVCLVRGVRGVRGVRDVCGVCARYVMWVCVRVCGVSESACVKVKYLAPYILLWPPHSSASFGPAVW